MPQNNVEKEALEAFMKEYGELVKKHEIDILAFPMFQPDGEGNWKIVIQTQPVSTKGQPIKSPFIQ